MHHLVSIEYQMNGDDCMKEMIIEDARILDNELDEEGVIFNELKLGLPQDADIFKTLMEIFKDSIRWNIIVRAVNGRDVVEKCRFEPKSETFIKYNFGPVIQGCKPSSLMHLTFSNW